MRLSIITCTYNSEKYLEECIDSVIAQNLDSDNYEHIFVDGHSTDKTLEIITTYKKNNSKRNIVLIQRQSKGIYNAMNEGIKIAKGEHLMFLNSDDFLKENILGEYLNFVDDKEGDVFYAQMNRIYNNQIKDIIGSYSKIKHFLFKLGFNVLVYHPTTIIKKSLFNELGYYNEDKKIASDYGFWLNCIKHKKSFVYFPHIVTNFRLNEGSITSNPANKQREIDENYYFRKKYLGWWGIIIHQISKVYICLSFNLKNND